MGIGCSRCGREWDNCECPDLEEIGENRDMFEAPVGQNQTVYISDGVDLSKEVVEDIIDLGSHYRNEFKGVKFDVYRVLQIFEVTDPVAQHIVKKLLRGTKKGHDEITVWNEVFQACERKKEMIEEDK